VSVHNIERLIFNIAHALLIPVLILVLAALAMVIIELGRLIVELQRRRKRNLVALDLTVVDIGDCLDRGDTPGALTLGHQMASSQSMDDTIERLIKLHAAPDSAMSADRVAKLLADFDYQSVRKLERTRILVRVGPALGLMGTLIPLSTGLAALARGNVAELSDDLRVAFSVTILGLLVGALAYAISLVRDRLYGEDLSDLEFLAAGLEPGAPSPRPEVSAVNTR